MLNAVYSKEYFDDHVDKYLNRDNNHQGIKISAIKELTKEMEFTVVLDLGCCIGTFALEFALYGKKTIGLDLSLYALQSGKRLAKAQKVQDRVSFINASAAFIPLNDNSIDIIFAEDIVEHLTPELLNRMLKESYRILRPNGKIIIHTFPTKYSNTLDLIEHKNILFLLYLFSLLPKVFIESFLYILDRFVFPLVYYILRGKSWKLTVMQDPHCNLQTLNSLKKELIRAKFEITSIYSTNLYKNFFPKKYFAMFAQSQVSKRNLISVATKKA